MDRSTIPGTPGAAHDARVLVIDDDAELREALALLLKEHGLTVDVAASASEGVRLARRIKPDCVLLDLGMPEIDGWEVIGVLRAARQPKRPYIIVMSGFTDARSRQRAFEAGADQYIVKEAGANALVAAVRTFFVRAYS